MSKLFLKVFGEELYNVFIIQFVMFLPLATLFLLVSVVLYAVSWLWKIGIVIAILVGIKVAHTRTINRLQSPPVILHD